MDRSEWVLVPRVPTDAMFDAGFEANGKQYAGDPMDDVVQRTHSTYTAMLAAAPPPPAEQASGEWSRAADELRRADALANKSDKIDRRKVIGKAADNNLSVILAALSQRPVVSPVGEVRIADGCIVSTSIKRPLSDGGYDITPQQPEKGEG